MTIEEFITARIDEDERAAAAASVEFEGESWTPAGDSVIVPTTSNIASAVEKAFDANVAHHIARHDPARVLRQVAALRGVIKAEIGNRTSFDSEYCTCDPDRIDECETWTPERSTLLRTLAGTWSDHPDYQEGWKP